MARIGIMTAADVSKRNMEHVLFRVAEILATEHDVDLVGAYKTSDRIARQFSIYAPEDTVHQQRLLSFLRPITDRVRLLRRYVCERQPNLLLAISGIGINGLSVALVGRIIGLPAIVRVTSDLFVVQKYKRPLSKRLRLFIQNNMLGRLSIVLATRTLVLHEIQIEGLSRAGFSRKRFAVGPPPGYFPPFEDSDETLAKVRGRLGISQDAFIVIYTGRVDQDKNFKLFADTAAYVLARRQNCYFLIVGNGSLRPYLEQRFRGQRMIFVDEVPRDNLAPYYMASNVFLLTSYSEGLSNVIIEALHFELPVISTDSGPITRAIVSNIGGSAKELGDIILSDDYKLDPTPDKLGSVSTEQLWLKLVADVINRKN